MIIADTFCVGRKSIYNHVETVFTYDSTHQAEVFS